ncbi:MAG TPA: hemerythrin domain-containing protein [Bacteroidales bacterium]|nr:hemerythrin domain-containing protein [Bacteroidales bacterium]HPT21816.1 hemerythrin domain-containing protein [Bacteroidales bacterium]
MKPTEDLIHEHKAIELMLGIMSKIADNIKNGKGFNIAEIDKIVDFLKTFADKCHHGKEENVLFPALVAAGIPKENGPVGVMLHEHTLGRGLIKEINEGAESFKSGNSTASFAIADSMLKYATLLHNHIHKENNILFPMADRTLSSSKQDEIYEQFEKIEEEVVGHGVHEQYHELLKLLKSKYA